jgi:hypothetical protein
MANIGQVAQGRMLDWILGAPATAPTRPSVYAVGLSLGSPTSTSASEVTLGSSNYTRQTLGATAFPPSSTVASSAFVSNSNAASFTNLSAATAFSGIQIWDSVLSNNSGNMLFYGLLATARTTIAGDALVLAAGALTVSLS